ncbi:UNVERIFIED_CONTAM: putative SprT family Zn-dependent metalloprotease [Paenibacillus sp. PvR008]
MPIPRSGDYFVLHLTNQNSYAIFMVTALFIREKEVDFETLMYYPSFNFFSLKEWGSDFFEFDNVRSATEKEINEFITAKSKHKDYKNLFIFTENFLQTEAKKLVKQHWRIDKEPLVALDFSECEDMKGACFNSANSLIEFWSEINRQLTYQEVIEMLMHELCHWYLFSTGQDFRDSDVRFAQELIRLGIGHTHNSRNSEAALAFRLAMNEEMNE